MSYLTTLGIEMQAVEVDAQRHQHTQGSSVADGEKRWLMLRLRTHASCVARQKRALVVDVSPKSAYLLELRRF